MHESTRRTLGHRSRKSTVVLDAEQAVSVPLTVRTTCWGDVRTLYNPPDPSVQYDIFDVSALVDKFRSASGAPIKAGGILAGAPGNPFGKITFEVLNVDFGFSHISAAWMRSAARRICTRFGRAHRGFKGVLSGRCEAGRKPSRLLSQSALFFQCLARCCVP